MSDDRSDPHRSPRLGDTSSPSFDEFDDRPITERGKPLLRAWEGRIPVTGPGHDTVPPGSEQPRPADDEETSEWPAAPATDVGAVIEAITDVYERTRARPPEHRSARRRSEIEKLLKRYLDDEA